MKFLITLVVFVAATHAATLEEQWQEFKLEHGKTYKSLLEEKRRFAIFQDNLREIEEHNEKFAKGEQSYYKGINQFTDMTQEEFEATASEMLPVPDDGIPREVFNDTGIVGNENINWVSRGWVTPVKNQLQCGSCWAFSAAGAIEGQLARAGRGLVNLSPQNLMDCATNGNRGCNGGSMDAAFQYVHGNGILTDAEYPYQARQMPCRKRGGVRISGYVDVPLNENSLLSALSSVGPISIGVDSSRLNSYAGGILDARSGCKNKPDHGVLLVGAGSENGRNYWLVKNSWGPRWGMNGYFKLVRGQSACAINSMNSYPRL